ncbi:enoyl-ACP reductase FabI [Aestuariispira insulae]|uniref:Enoyl-[acyl-carrier-protein] reductase [NADH] n=1 Tax=Aestuariispira insulae TaxID=1461337 RepID=A0A3D9HQ13_9PROT|nr:SDR family oxidoreductase [Aestuariispira insulae]RED51578.1 enoyl-[acyl-carrier-protein] reductase [NADH] [Aestuariispira insulae]
MSEQEKQGIMAGKRGIVMGVANDHSIAWGIAQALAKHGAELAFTYQGDTQAKRVKPLADSIGSEICISCDVENDQDIQRAFNDVADKWGSVDFVVHAIAYSDKNELKGRYVDTTRDNFARTMDISCYSFTAVAKAAEAVMPNGGSLITLSYAGSERVMPSYNVMGVAKAALEASVRYLATDLGSKQIRVNAISAGPMRTLAGSAISGARFVYNWQGENSPLRRNITLDDLGGCALYFLSDLSTGVTGETHHVDSGYHVIGMAVPEA